MEKLYKVSLHDYADWGYLLDESIYKDPLEARKEFKRVKKWIMENDMDYVDNEDDFNAFTNFTSPNYKLKFEVVKANEKMAFTEQKKCKWPVYDDGGTTIELIVDSINENAKSFKDAYIEAKSLSGSFIAGRMIDGKMYITLDPEDRDEYGYVNIVVSKDGNRFKAELETHVNWN